MNEVWKPVPGYNKYYSASNIGRIKSEARKVIGKKCHYTVRERILSPGVDRCGYKTVALYKGGRKTRLVHQLVLETFIGQKKSGEEANHIDANTGNNMIENLEWVSNKKHHEITQKQGRMPKGTQVHTSKLNEDQVKEIRIRSKGKITMRNLAREYNVSHSNIFHIVHRKSWKHIL